MTALINKRIVLAADDLAEIELLEELLEDGGYDDVLRTRPDRLAALCSVADPDLIVLSSDLQGYGSRGGLAALRDLTAAGDTAPVLLIGPRDSDELPGSTLSLSTADFITRPVRAAELLVRVRNLLHISQLARTLAERNDVLDQAVRDRTRKMEQARRETLEVLASIGEYHDDGTRQHAQRVGIYAALIAEELALPGLLVARIRDAAPLHDLGKIGISRRVLLKPGRLSPAERENMQRHVQIGVRILRRGRSPVLRLAAEIARTHHERWDGLGYPAGLAGEEIPLSGRITAVADVFDALIHDRPYRVAWEPDAALEEIANQAGRQFDAQVVEAFLAIDRETLLRGVAATARADSPRDDEPDEGDAEPEDRTAPAFAAIGG